MAVTPLAGSSTRSRTPTFTLTPTSTFMPGNPTISGVVYRVDTWQGPWQRATARSDGAFSAPTPALQPGVHILYAYATNAEAATSTNTGQGSGPLVGTIAAYLFVVLKDVPVAVHDTVITMENRSITVPAPGVLGNDSGVDASPLTATMVSGPGNGTAIVDTDGSFTYTPNAGYSGPDSFTYAASDGSADSNVATVTITVVNDAPGDDDANGTTDVAVYRPWSGAWYVQSPFHAVHWGEPATSPCPATTTATAAPSRPSTARRLGSGTCWAPILGSPVGENPGTGLSHSPPPSTAPTSRWPDLYPGARRTRAPGAKPRPRCGPGQEVGYRAQHGVRALAGRRKVCASSPAGSEATSPERSTTCPCCSALEVVPRGHPS